MSEKIDVDYAFNPEKRQAQQELDDYMASRPETGEGQVDVLDNEGSYVDAIDRAIETDPVLRRMAHMADEIREIGNTTVTVNDAEQLTRMHNDKQDKLAELLATYSDSDSAPEIESKEDVMDRILNRTHEAPVVADATESADAEEASEASEKDGENADESDIEDAKGDSEFEGEPADDEKADVVTPSAEDYADEEQPLFGEDGEPTPAAAPLDTSALDEIAQSEDDTDPDQADDETPAPRRRRRDRVMDWVKNPIHTAAERYTNRNKRRTRLLGGAALLASGAAAAYMMWQGNNPLDGHNGEMPAGGGDVTPDNNDLKDLLDVDRPGQDGGDGSPDVEPGKNIENGSDVSGNGSFADGTGGETLMQTIGLDRDTWYQNQEEFAKRFPGLTYRMDDGNIGLLDQNMSTDVSRLPKAAQAFWQKRA